MGKKIGGKKEKRKHFRDTGSWLKKKIR